MNEEREPVITVTRSEFKGHGMIVLSSGTNEKYPFQFGLQKAKRILACLEEIKQFVADEEARLGALPKKVAVK